MSLLWEPIGPYVLARLEPDPEKSEGGMYLPQTVAQGGEKPVRGRLQRATVVSVSDGHCTRKGVWVRPQVKPGDEVLLSRYMGTEFACGGEKYVCVEEEHVAAVVD
jgi:chaperonin GroES